MTAEVRDFSTTFYPNQDDVRRICRPGAGADTCIWLVMAPSGWECLCLNRPIALLDRWQQGQTVAKRDGCATVRQFLPLWRAGSCVVPYAEEDAPR